MARPVSRFARTIRSLLLIGAVGVFLGVYNAYNSRRDVAMATGPQSEAQRQFFISTADRPDLAQFYKDLRPAQRVEMARNIGRYQDPQLAKLIGVTLADFYAPAREALTESMTKLAAAHPEAVAEQMKLTGSFQKLGVTKALMPLGPKVVPMVVKQLTVGDARPNAVAFLVEVGEPAVVPLVKELDSDNADVRKAAADALSKIGSKTAVAALTQKYRTTDGDEQLAYLSALSSIGVAESEPLFADNLRDEANSLPRRATAAVGLGRIASPSAARLLWGYAEHPDLDFRAQILSALQLAGDRALEVPSVPPMVQLQVAAKVNSPLATSITRRALNSAPSVTAIEAAEGKPELVPDLVAVLRKDARDGEIADRAVAALESTEAGRSGLEQLAQDPAVSAFIERRRRIAS